MKKILDWKERTVVQHFNEVTLWSAPFGRLLLENIPMQSGMTLADIGFGTGFPLIELSQRFGNNSTIYGIDIWEEAIRLVKEKIQVFDIQNIQILEESATKINLPDEHIDLVTSNLGINNFEYRERVYREIYRILKPNGKLCITTNPIGTFEELFVLFDKAFELLKLPAQRIELQKYIQNRQNQEIICRQFVEQGFTLSKSKSDLTQMRFVDAETLLNHSLIRIGFRASWEEMLPEQVKSSFFETLKKLITKEIQTSGEFKMSIPMLYLEFDKTQQ